MVLFSQVWVYVCRVGGFQPMNINLGKGETGMYFQIIHQDDRNTQPKTKTGVYYVMKNRTIAKFEFDGVNKTGIQAFQDMQYFLFNRKDSDQLNVQLLGRD